MNRLAMCLATLLVLCTVATTAYAEDRKPDQAKKTKAEALIAETKSEGVWRTDDTGEITHIQSGLRCSVADANDIIQMTGLTVYPSADKGMDVSCSYTMKGEAGVSHITVYAYAAAGRSSEQLIQQSVAEARAVHPDWKLTDRSPVSMSITDQAGKKVTPLTATFAYGASPEMYSTIWVAAVETWAIKVRTTYPKADANTAELMSVVWWASARLKITGNKPASTK